LPDGGIAWSKAFLLKAEGSLTDRTDMVTELGPILELFDIRALPTTDVGILSAWTTTHNLSFGDLSVGVDLVKGELLSRDSRLVAVPSANLATLWALTIRRVLQGGSINARTTFLIDEEDASKARLRLNWEPQDIFDVAIRQALLNTYFNHPLREQTK
jgi:hypothetical protein